MTIQPKEHYPLACARQWRALAGIIREDTMAPKVFFRTYCDRSVLISSVGSVLVAQRVRNLAKLELRLDGLPSGICPLKVYSEDGIVTKRLCVQH